MKHKYVKCLIKVYKEKPSMKSFYCNRLKLFEIMERASLLKRVIATNDHAGINIFIDGNLKY